MNSSRLRHSTQPQLSREIKIVDTTLREGEQAPGFVFSPKDKQALALQLEQIGIGQVEAGVPAMGAEEKEAVRLILESRTTILVSTWNRTRVEDIKHSLECRPDIVHICAPVSELMLWSKLKKSNEWLRSELRRTVEFALEKGMVVTVGFEDASRAELGFMIPLAESLHALGVSGIRLADTLGILTPSAVYNLVAHFDVPVGVHFHNDLGMAVANTFAACRAGAVQIDTTLFGIGERAGNCDVHSLVDAYGTQFNFGIHTEKLKKALHQAKNIIWKKHVVTKRSHR
jgi:homocitrate synthase NifV